MTDRQSPTRLPDLRVHQVLHKLLVNLRHPPRS